MHCRYCRAWNTDDEHRCVRCGRRLHLANARPAPETYPIQTATAPDLSRLSRAVDSEAAQPMVEPQPARLTYQRPLFQEMQHVMKIPVLPAAEPHDSKPRTARPRPPRRAHTDQQLLDFSGPKVRTSLEAVIYCDSPVAAPVHRLIGAVLDISLVLIGLGLFMAIFQVAGGPIALTLETLPVMALVAAGVWFFYNLLFSIAGGDTPGTGWAHLRLVNYDGQPPTRDQRIYRVLASYLSIMAAGMGLLWALVDEESLTWHDHMTRTFPTPRED
jgi:uncharacterized RDD family membrane protein YckC